ncbi:MAG: hypothetical protein R3261_07185, partial [Alphaproteobacteria bacterium]|nr:hypothetical protein [Alphaproteobacteria bacterium]
LAILFGPSLLIWAYGKVMRQTLSRYTGYYLGFSFAFMFFGMGHFIVTDGMAMMLPAFVPEKVFLVYLSGILEFAIAAGILVSPFRRHATILAIIVLIGFFPINVYAALNYVEFGGHAWGPVYLLVRGPLQLVLIAWGYFLVYRPYRSI